MKKSSVKAEKILICILPIICCAVFRLLKLTGETDMRVIMRLALAGILVYGAYSVYKKQFNAEKAVFMLILAGCVIRIGYTLYTHAFTRSYDVGMNNAEGVGHWGYFYHIINGHLPPGNEYQFYQPPLYYIVGAFFVKIMMLIKGTNEWGGLEYIPQIVSCVCSIIVMITTVKIMDRLNIKKAVQVIPIALLAFYPAQIFAAGRINNDSMVQMFIILSLYATLKWHQSQKMKDIIFIAFAIGLGMMTKINCAITAFIAGPLMIYHFVQAVKKKDVEERKKLVIQFSVFAIICFPLGLWYGIRNYIEFGQPLNFVHELPEGLAIYTGHESWVKRWITFPLFHFKAAPYSDMPNDANIWMLLIKSGVHGEFTWDSISLFLAWAIDYIHLMLMLMALFAVLFSFIKDKSLNKTAKFAPLWVWAVIAVSYIQFNISYTFSCTADFRYVLPAQIASSFFIAYMCEYLYKRKEMKVCRYGLSAYGLVIILFCAMSIFHFC